tara:strand:- start:1201 stop:1686 length:486 start_codon:yes stop_codon:yes gene_type:complete
MGYGLPDKLRKKVDKEVRKIFEVETFKLDPVILPDTFKAGLPTAITPDNFFMVRKEAVLLGYAFVDKASSKTAQFDYLVLLDPELKIVHSKVLIYREEYGGEIGSSRWLKQFLGKTGKDRVDLKSNIDGISGATISVRSMTMAMDNLLQSIGILQKNNALK